MGGAIEISVNSIPDSILTRNDNDVHSVHASTAFLDEDIENWFYNNLVFPVDWELEYPTEYLESNINSSINFTSYIDSFLPFGYKVLDIQNNSYGNARLKIVLKGDKSKFFNFSGRADYLVTTSEDFSIGTTKMVCVIEIQSKKDKKQCLLQLLSYLLILMNSKNLPWLVGFLVYNDGSCRAFRATRDNNGGCIYEMDSCFHVSHIAEMMNIIINEIKSNYNNNNINNLNV